MHGRTPQHVARTIDECKAALYTNFGRLSGAILYEADDIRWFATAVPDPLFNGVIYAHFKPSTLDKQIESALHHFKQHSIPMLWHIGPATQPSDLGPALIAHGLTHVEDEPGMAVDLLAAHEPWSAPAELTFEPVTDIGLLQQWVGVWAFPLSAQDQASYVETYGRLGLGPHKPLQHFLGHLNGVPVATVSLFYHGRVAAIEHVVTLPEARRQGIGRTITSMAMTLARNNGCTLGVLSASPMGINIYRRLGFQPYCMLGTYAWSPSPASSST